MTASPLEMPGCDTDPTAAGFGGGGQGKTVIDLARRRAYRVVGIIDDNLPVNPR